MTAQRTARQRLSRGQWLGRALGLLAREGEQRLQIENLCRDLGVTKGSFYWHFENRADFVRQLADHWSHVFTSNLIDQLTADGVHGAPKLKRILDEVHEHGLARYDAVMVSWAGHDSIVAEYVRGALELRYEIVRSGLAEAGVPAAEIDIRVQLFYGYATRDAALVPIPPAADAASDHEYVVALLTGRSGDLPGS